MLVMRKRKKTEEQHLLKFGHDMHYLIYTLKFLPKDLFSLSFDIILLKIDWIYFFSF